jgi:hypothetical protein
MDKTILILRMMAFERVIGELNSIKMTFSSSESEKYADFKKAMDDFIKEVKDNALAE